MDRYTSLGLSTSIDCQLTFGKGGKEKVVVGVYGPKPRDCLECLDKLSRYNSSEFTIQYKKKTTSIYYQ